MHLRFLAGLELLGERVTIIAGFSFAIFASPKIDDSVPMAIDAFNFFILENPDFVHEDDKLKMREYERSRITAINYVYFSREQDQKFLSLFFMNDMCYFFLITTYFS